MSEENINIEQVDVPEVEAPETPAAVAEPEVKVHPGWEKMLAELPEAWHDKVSPYLIENDKNVQSQLEKFTPFKEFVDNGLQPEVIRDSLRLADVALNDPVYLYRALGDQLRQQGLFDEAEQADAQADAIEEQNDGEDYELSPALRKEFENRDAILLQQQEYLRNMQYEQEVYSEQTILESEINEINSRYDIPAQTMERILSVMELQLQRGEDATVYTAARELAEITGIRYNEKGAAPKADAPLVMGGNGGAGVPSNDFTIPKDDKGKREMLANMFEQQIKAQQNSI